MKKAGLLGSPRRGVIRASQRGFDVLKSNPKRIDVAFLERFPEFVEFRALRREANAAAANGAAETTPEEALEDAYQRLRAGRLDSKIILIDGAMLAGLMVDHSVGVSSVRSYALLKIDPDYFSED